MSTDNWGLMGHEWAVNMLQHQIQEGAVRHAYLFTGAPGVGRRTLALRFAQALNCPNPPAPGEACRTCQTCKQIEKMQYPDLTILRPESRTKVLDIEHVREVKYSLSLTPFQGKYRVAIFLEFQRLSGGSIDSRGDFNLRGSFNALLKVLEEAPPHVILILTAENSVNLPPTIVSRCEELRLKPLSIDLMHKYIINRGRKDEKAKLVAHISNGRPGNALRYLASPDLMDKRILILDIMYEILHSSRVKRFDFAEKISKQKNNPYSEFIDKQTTDTDMVRQIFITFLETWSSFWRDVMLVSSGSNVALTNIDRQEEIVALSQKFDLALARRLVLDIERSIQRLERNVNTRLLLEVLLLDWPYLK